MLGSQQAPGPHPGLQKSQPSHPGPVLDSHRATRGSLSALGEHSAALVPGSDPGMAQPPQSTWAAPSPPTWQGTRTNGISVGTAARHLGTSSTRSRGLRPTHLDSAVPLADTGCAPAPRGSPRLPPTAGDPREEDGHRVLRTGVTFAVAAFVLCFSLPRALEPHLRELH